MIHGDIVTLTSDGIVVPEKALQPLGIFDQSICWGVWAANPNERPESSDPESSDPESSDPDPPTLIISPFHPRSWPFLMRLEILLAEKKGSLARGCEILKENNLSILFSECTSTGFTHATWNVIAESTKKDFKNLKEEKQNFDKKHPRVRVYGRDFADAQKIANRISAEMLHHAWEVEDKLNSSNDEFLHKWDLESKKRRFLFKLSLVKELMKAKKPEKAERKIEEYISKHCQPATAHYMQRLAYFSVYGGGRYVPFALRFQADSSLLKLQDDIFSSKKIWIHDDSKQSYENIPRELDSLPIQAIATFNSQDKYLRLKPLTHKILKESLTRIHVEYQLDMPAEHAPEGSQGLLGLICNQLRKGDVNLLHNSNKWTRYEYYMEEGLISFLADVRNDKYDSIESSIKAINHIIDTDENEESKDDSKKLKGVSIKDVDVYEDPQRKLFLSYHSGTPRESDILKIIRKAAAQYGFYYSEVTTHVDPITRKVIKHIGDCHAFLQLLLFRADDNPETVSFSWLDFEYGVASGRRMPAIRLADTTRVSSDYWTKRITTHRDQGLKFFRSDANCDELEKDISEAIKELAGELVRKQESE